MIPVVALDPTGPDLLSRMRDAWEAGAAVLPRPSGHGPAPTRAPEGTALVVRTSGSTGRPRHVTIPRTALDAAVTASLARLGCARGERWALALPTHHVAGLLVLLRADALGTSAVPLDPAGDPGALGTVNAEHVAVVPTQLVRALRAGGDLRHLRTVLVGGGPLDPDIRDAARDRGVRVVESYGATETCGGCVYDGVPLDGVRLSIGPEGEVRVGGRTLATGYADDPDATAAAFVDGWFVTGDVGRIVDGRLEVIGRRDDVAVSGGLNIPLGPVTAALRTAPGVADAIAVGVADREWGVVVRAVIEAAPGAGPRLDDLRSHVAGVLPRTHAPRELLLVDRIDRDGLGKLTAGARDDLVRAAPTERLD